jgi:hypothetical protein
MHQTHIQKANQMISYDKAQMETKIISMQKQLDELQKPKAMLIMDKTELKDCIIEQCKEVYAMNMKESRQNIDVQKLCEMQTQLDELQIETLPATEAKIGMLDRASKEVQQSIDKVNKT